MKAMDRVSESIESGGGGDNLDAVGADADADAAMFIAPANVSAADADTTDGSNGEVCGDK